MNWKEWVPTVLLVVMLGGAVVFYNRKDNGPAYEGLGQPKADRNPSCLTLAGEPLERVRNCLGELPKAKLSAPVKELVAEIAQHSKILLIGNADPGVSTLKLGSHPDIESMMMGIDEPAVAKALRDLGIRGVLVARDLTGAVDRDNVVLARLAHHDHLEWFQLRYVTDEVFVYTVRTSPTRLPIETANDLLVGLRARLEGKPPPKQRWNPEVVRLIGTMRLQGGTLASRHVVGENPAMGSPLERALDDLASRLIRDWERDIEVMGHGPLPDRLDDLRLEIHVVMEKAPVEPRSRFALFDLWEMGVDGMIFQQREADEGEESLNEKFTFMPGSELVVRSLHSADEFLRAATRDFGWYDPRPWEKDPKTRLDIIRGQHFMERDIGGGPAVRLVRGMPEVPTATITDKRVQDMLVAGGEWWLANLLPDNRFEYKYWPEQNRRSTEYNEVRHILGARDLADTWRYRNDQRYLDGSYRAMSWLLEHAVYAKDKPQGPLPHPPADTLLFRVPKYSQATPAEPANQKLGTVAVGLLGWIAWADASGSKAEDERIRQMANFVRSQQEPDGRFTPYYVHPEHAYVDSRNDIVPGEAMLALAMVAEYFGDNTWIEGYGRFVEFYQPWFRERAVRKRPTGRWPHDTYENPDRLDLVQFGPWSVMAAQQVHALTGDERAGQFGLEVADWMIDNYQWRSDRLPWPDYEGGYYKLPEELPAMQTFCYSEGTAAAYALATRFAPERAEKYEQSTREAIRFMEVMQYDELDSYMFSHPEKIRGGIKYTMNENKIRIDYVGHALSTLSQYLDARVQAAAVQGGAADLWDPSEVERPAGNRGSVPTIDYSEVPVMVPTGELPHPRNTPGAG